MLMGLNPRPSMTLITKHADSNGPKSKARSINSVNAPKNQFVFYSAPRIQSRGVVEGKTTSFRRPSFGRYVASESKLYGLHILMATMTSSKRGSQPSKVRMLQTSRFINRELTAPLELSIASILNATTAPIHSAHYIVSSRTKVL